MQCGEAYRNAGKLAKKSTGISLRAPAQRGKAYQKSAGASPSAQVQCRKAYCESISAPPCAIRGLALHCKHDSLQRHVVDYYNKLKARCERDESCLARVTPLKHFRVARHCLLEGLQALRFIPSVTRPRKNCVVSARLIALHH